MAARGGIGTGHLGSDAKLRPKAWKAEVADLTAQKDRLYREMRSLREEVAEAETVKRCVEQAIPRQNRERRSQKHKIYHCDPFEGVV